MPQPKATKVPEIAQEYEIVDPGVKADSSGNMGGQRVYSKDNKRYVKMTAKQAEWYLQHGAIALVGAPSP